LRRIEESHSLKILTPQKTCWQGFSWIPRFFSFDRLNSFLAAAPAAEVSAALCPASVSDSASESSISSDSRSLEGQRSNRRRQLLQEDCERRKQTHPLVCCQGLTVVSTCLLQIEHFGPLGLAGTVPSQGCQLSCSHSPNSKCKARLHLSEHDRRP